MPRHACDVVMYKTNAGEVPAVITALYDTNGDQLDQDVDHASVVTADLLTLGYQGTRVTGAPRADEGTAGKVALADIDTVEAGEWYIPGLVVSS